MFSDAVRSVTSVEPVRWNERPARHYGRMA
jgi:hypothetical protein